MLEAFEPCIGVWVPFAYVTADRAPQSFSLPKFESYSFENLTAWQILRKICFEVYCCAFGIPFVLSYSYWPDVLAA